MTPAPPPLPAAAVAAHLPAGVVAFVRDKRLTRYRTALADLNGDGRPEALVYAIGDVAGGGLPDLCGSGGCTLFVLSLTPTGYRKIAGILITRPPIRVLPTASHGWRDLGVSVAGGGILPGYEARLRFNGRSYPLNPTVPPAGRIRDADGTVVMAADPPVSPP